MAGHNKWSKIKHRKAATDAKKSNIYTKMAKLIMVAVKTGGGPDPAHNFRLKAAIDKAKENGVPKSNIERAIDKASGKGEGDDLKEITYEGYLPGGVAVMVFAATDNSNRAYNDVRTIFTKSHGSLGTSGSVAYLFERKGQIKLAKPEDWDNCKEEQLLELAMDSGFEDVDFEQDDELLLYTSAGSIEANAKLLEDKLGGDWQIISSGDEMIAAETVTVESEDDAKNILKAMEALEDNDDVIDVVSNFDIDEKLIAAV